MSEYSGNIASVNWRALVREAIRRRRAEKLTQREHAALASVSIPTIVAFDRGERTLSLAKAFDILRVVGLVEEPPEEGAQELFVRDAFARWRSSPGSSPKILRSGFTMAGIALIMRSTAICATSRTPMSTGFWIRVWLPITSISSGTPRAYISPAMARQAADIVEFTIRFAFPPCG
jgi:hypothetical protein